MDTSSASTASTSLPTKTIVTDVEQKESDLKQNDDTRTCPSRAHDEERTTRSDNARSLSLSHDSAIYLQFKSKGNEAMKKKKWQDAVKYYTDALNCEGGCGEETYKVYTNRATASLKWAMRLKTKPQNTASCVDTLMSIVDDSEASAKLCPTWWKAYQAKGLALGKLYKLKEASTSLKKATELLRAELAQDESSAKVRKSLSLVEKNTLEVENKSPVVVSYFESLDRALPERASLPDDRFGRFDAVFKMLNNIDACARQWPRADKLKIERDVNFLVRVYEDAKTRNVLDSTLAAHMKSVSEKSKALCVPALKMKIALESFGAPVTTMPPPGTGMGP